MYKTFRYVWEITFWRRSLWEELSSFENSLTAKHIPQPTRCKRWLSLNWLHGWRLYFEREPQCWSTVKQSDILQTSALWFLFHFHVTDAVKFFFTPTSATVSNLISPSLWPWPFPLLFWKHIYFVLLYCTYCLFFKI